jgi:phosphoglycerate dehydrogenase-like enzyme/predicted dehydrogenase
MMARGTDMRVLVIGAGPTAMHEHLPVLARLRDQGELVLSLICDIDRARAASARRQFGFLEDTGDGVGALQRADIDAAYIFGSAQLHYEYGLLALRSGKHLFVEKPVAPTFTQAAELARLAAERHLVAVGGHNRRYFKSLTMVRERAGKTGWRFAEAVFHKAEFGRPPPFGARTWLSANGIHALDALLFVMGGPPEHIASHSGSSAGATEASTFSATMRWPNGAQGVFLCNNNAGSRREEYAFHREGESFSVDGDGLTIHGGHASSKHSFPAIGDGFTDEHAAFVQAIRSGSKPLNELGELAPSLFLAELIEAGFSGKVQLPNAVSHRVLRTHDDAESILVVHSAELQPGLARLLSKYRLVSLQDLRESVDPRSDVVAAILGRGAGPLPPEILDKIPGLRVVGVMALSLARYEPEALMRRGIAVINASAAYADSVAEFALGLAILGRRRAFASSTIMRTGGWGSEIGPVGLRGLFYRTARGTRPLLRAARLETWSLALWRRTTTAKEKGAAAKVAVARELRGAVVGLVGWGENARTFAAHLLRLGARVLVYSEHAPAEAIVQSGATPATLGEVLTAEIVSLHRGLTPSTHHFLRAPELAHLRPGTVLINIARGALIDPDALLARLKQGDIFACLDTFEVEPLPTGNPLRNLPNVFLTSHMAGGSGDMHAAAADEVLGKVAAYLAGESGHAISAPRLRTMT